MVIVKDLNSDHLEPDPVQLSFQELVWSRSIDSVTETNGESSLFSMSSQAFGRFALMKGL